MQSNVKRRFVDAYLNEVGDMRIKVNRLQLYEIIISAGKDLLISDLGDTEYYSFDRAFEVFEQLSATNVSEIIEQNRNGTEKIQQFIEFRELSESLKEVCMKFISPFIF
uniref:Cullin domain-containing protein n=1 Tax=Elaeophora elaphi TaxID=1147741 RepID=A0A0R3RFM2_9BILA